MFDLTGLDDWATLPFFENALPKITAALHHEDDPVYPPFDHTFRALRLCPPCSTRVVILGQDPYHTPGKADGLAFSIPRQFGGKLDSLGNIFKEIESDLHAKRTRTDLTDWAEQGVLLLNTALSVPQGRPKAHARLGWSMLTRQVIAHLADTPRAFILWGKPAQSFAPKTGGHLIVQSAHPSPLSAYRGFFSSRPFSTVNQWLIEQGDTPIHWTDP